MRLQHDYIIDVATGASRLTKKWRNKRMRWSELVAKCEQTTRTRETAAEYAAMSKEEQSNIKDVGGFVGGYLNEGERRNGRVKYRSVATLDIDYGTPDVWDDFTSLYGCAAMLYSTHKHSAKTPRYRLVLPLSRPAEPDEYEPICRRIAEGVGLDLFDDSTYELPRLFYWPSTSADADYVFEVQDGPALNVDEILRSYVDYRDCSAWPVSSREGEVVRREIKRVGDPCDKPGLIGAFCRAYTIEDAIDKFLGDIYEPTTTDGRYTYKAGSVAGGVVTYDGKYAYSHHDTDPASRQLCNAFDLCRIHLYGDRDEGSRATDVTKLPSYAAMQKLADEDPEVRKLLGRERLEAAAVDFSDLEIPEDYSDEWRSKLTSHKGRYESTAGNVITILEHDPALRGKLTHDLFAGVDVVTGKLPWPKIGTTANQWTDTDDANLRVYLERCYGITGKDKINDARDHVVSKNGKHPIRDYLNSLTWDGVPRLERLIIDYIGADDNELNRAMTRKHFTAAVARVMHPGCKYDYCLIMTGPEGVGKSTLLNVMGGEWFNDSITTTEGKEGMECLRRAWIVEMGELSSIKRSDVESVKAYLSKRVDIYRAAYGRRTTEHPRQCVFCGTTNEALFLKGDTGNRRFWVIDVDPSKRKHDDWLQALTRDRDQLWAEAVSYYRAGEKLYLSAELETQARERQESFNDAVDDPMADNIRQYLDTLLPSDWEEWSSSRRRAWYNDPDPLDCVGTVRRDKVTAAEFIVERMGIAMTHKDYKYTARKVSKILGSLPGWERMSTTRHVEKLYGIQRGFKRVEEVNREAEIDDL